MTTSSARLADLAARAGDGRPPAVTKVPRTEVLALRPLRSRQGPSPEDEALSRAFAADGTSDVPLQEAYARWSGSVHAFCPRSLSARADAEEAAAQVFVSRGGCGMGMLRLRLRLEVDGGGRG